MQYLVQNKDPAWKLTQITKNLLLVLACLLVWFMPALHAFWQKLDVACYALLNQSLLHSRAWQLFWGYLNHPNETWLNLVAMGSINILAIATLCKEKRPRAISLVIYFWFFFQLVLLFTQKAFIGGLHLQRHSPSIVHEPWLILSEALGIGNIKVYSHCCFPAGHVLVLVFWAKFTLLYCNDQIKKLVIFTAVLLTLPRLFSGAHWLSDILFTIVYSWFWFTVAIGTPLYSYITKTIETKIKTQNLIQGRV